MRIYGYIKQLVELWMKKDGQDVKFTPNSNTYVGTTSFTVPPRTSGSGELVGTSETQTLTNKTLGSTNTLTGATAASLTNGGTVTIPSGTDTLVARTSTDTLTNKTISGSSNTITNVSLTTAVTGVLPTANGGTGQNSTAAFPASGTVATVPSSGVVKSNGTVLSSSNVSLTTEVTGILPSANGGTGVNNAGNLTYGANNVTFTTSGVTSLTLPTTGTVATLAGSESLSNKTLASPVITTAAILDNNAELRLRETTANGTDYIALRAPTSVTTNTTLILPNGAGVSGQVLTTDGTGILSWGSAGGTLAYNNKGDTGPTLTVADGQFIRVSLTATRNLTLPTTSVPAGYRIEIVNSGAFDLVIKSSDGTTITSSNAASGSVGDPTIQVGAVVLEATQSTPTAPGHWRVVHVHEKNVATASTPFTGAITQNFIIYLSRVGTAVTAFLITSTATASASNFLGIPTGTLPARFRVSTGFVQRAATVIISNNQVISAHIRIDDDGGGAIQKYDVSNFSGVTGMTASAGRTSWSYVTDIA